MENFEGALARSNRLINSSLIIGISLLGVVFVVSVGLYLKTFNGALSSQSGDWSALGSFFGGVFGPAISIVTLIALLKTLKLQHHTLMSQKADSESVISLQKKSYDAQAEQLLLAKAELNSAKIADFKNSIIRVFEQRITYFQHSQADALNRMSALSALGETPEIIGAMKKIAESTVLYKNELEKLLKCSLKLSFEEFNSIQEVKIYIASLHADDMPD
ncbi:hypothetical protein [Pseudomonas sp. B21-048]|uniref:hypothetical protein n=1 Tax=Pseudomonas sp. B21-048 TaxID=2895490 RepID=UPI00215F3DFA|nr:hypothetical protein [Pseudomonas sp. B21-048]UVK96497.1 hypothetical protein LOY56_13790 [Pseudomonas sp. B21-048]